MGGSVANSRHGVNGRNTTVLTSCRWKMLGEDLAKSWTAKSFFKGKWARCRAGRFSNVDEVTSLFHGRHLQIIKPTLRSVGLRAGFLLGEERGRKEERAPLFRSGEAWPRRLLKIPFAGSAQSSAAKDSKSALVMAARWRCVSFLESVIASISSRRPSGTR